MNISLLWDNIAGRGDWQVSNGRISTGHVLRSAVLISLFTDRVAQPGYVAEDGSQDRYGWWHDSFDGIPIGSRLWQLRRRKIANRSALILEATDIAIEALEWIKTANIASAITVTVTAPSASQGRSGTMLNFDVVLRQPQGNAPLITALWRAA